MDISVLLENLKDIIPAGTDAYLKIKEADEYNKRKLAEMDYELAQRKRTNAILIIFIVLLSALILFKFYNSK